jgi:hypothetical protein
VTPDPDDTLPDLTLLLEPGILIEKLYVETDNRILGFAGIHRLGSDALLGFIIKLQRSIEDRSGGMEDSQHFYESVDLGLDDVPAEGFRFQLSRPQRVCRLSTTVGASVTVPFQAEFRDYVTGLVNENALNDAIKPNTK